MGFLNKAATSRRTQEERIPLSGLVGGNTDNIENRIREATCGLGAQRIFTSGSRGRTNALVDAMRQVEATIWFTSSDLGIGVAFGAEMAIGSIRDWAIEGVFTKGGENEDFLVLNTPEQTTSDGQLLSAQYHDQIRDSFRKPADGSANHSMQALVANNGLIGSVEAFEYIGWVEAPNDSTITTTLSLSEVRKVCESFSLPLLQSEASKSVWSLNMFTGSDRHILTAEFFDLGDKREIRMKTEIPDTNDLFAEMVCRRNGKLPALILAYLIKAHDPDSKHVVGDGN